MLRETSLASAGYASMSNRKLAALIASAIALIATLLAVAGPGAQRAQAAAPAACPNVFNVLHNDRIGELKLPKGWYRITLLDDQARLSCERAAKLFGRFLQDYDGKLPKPWQLNVERAKFKKQGKRVGFRVKKVSGGGGGGGGGKHPSGKHTKCPTFRIQHNDMISGVMFKKGTYQMTALGRFTCQRSVKRLQAFLESGQIADGWRLRKATGTFLRNGRNGFQINYWGR